MTENSSSKLAIFGGSPIRNAPMPARKLFDVEARKATNEVFDYYQNLGVDFGSNGYFEKKYETAFINFLNPSTLGYAEVTSSGTASIFIALQALHLPASSEILVSSITDPGMVNPALLLGHKIKLVDNAKNSAHTNLSEIEKRVSPRTKCLILNHLAGQPIPEIKKISEWAKQNNIYLIEDCSQAHGASIDGGMVGTFGDISCFSTMFSKNHSSGGAGGICYTKNLSYAQRLEIYANKGKPMHRPGFNEKNPATFEVPALNLKLNEISCSIGLSTLKKLSETNKKRKDFLQSLDYEIRKAKLQTKLYTVTAGDAPFFAIFQIDKQNLNISKAEFATAIQKEGISINPHYPYLIHEWGWTRKYLVDDFVPENATAFRDSSFNLLFHENFKEQELYDIVKSIQKVETYFYHP